jgi:hypothetical protein
MSLIESGRCAAMKTRIVISTTAIVVIAVGIALILTHGADTMHALRDAIAIMILVTILSLQTWLRDRLFHPAEEVAVNKARRPHTSRTRRQDRTRLVRGAGVVRGSLKDESATG